MGHVTLLLGESCKGWPVAWHKLPRSPKSSLLDFFLFSCMNSRAVFLNRRAAARYWTLASVIPGH